MKKIKLVKSIYIPVESNSISELCIQEFDARNFTDENVLKCMAPLRKSNGKLTGILNSSSANPYTIPLQKVLALRNSILSGGRDMIKAYKNWVFDTEKREAAEKLSKVFKRHAKKLYRHNYQKQSSVVHSLIKELKSEEMQILLNVLTMLGWFDELIKSQDQFDKTFSLKAAYANGKESLVKRDAQITVNEDLEILINYINTMIAINSEDEVWIEIYNNINGIVKQITKRARIRRSNMNNNTEEE